MLPPVRSSPAAEPPRDPDVHGASPETAMMFSTTWARRAAGPALAGAGVFTPPTPGITDASASNLTITTGGVVYHGTAPNRPGGSAYQNAISYDDCVRDGWSVDVPVEVTNATGTLQLWAGDGSSCLNDLARLGNGRCRPLPLRSSGAGVFTVTVHDLLGALGIRGCVDDSGQTQAHTVTLSFLLAGSPETTAGTLDPANVATLQITVDLVGPRPPPVLRVDPEDGILKLELPPPGDQDTLGYYVFLDPNPNRAQETDAGGPDCAAGAGDPGASACPPLPCVDPRRPSLNSSARYDATITSTASSVVIDGLDNDQRYTLAVAGYDAVGNIGPLSALQCGTPQPTETLFKRYCLDGGSACVDGCGSCWVGAGDGLSWPGLLAAAAATLGLAARRRARAPR